MSGTLIDAIQRDDVALVRKLLSKSGFDVNAGMVGVGITPLMISCLHGNIDTINVLLKAGADVNSQNKSGDTCLMLACRTGNVQVVKVLIASKADVNLKNQWKQPAIFDAIAKEDVATVKLLIAAGADVNAVNDGGVTPLAGAVMRKNQDIMKVLFQAGAKMKIDTASRINSGYIALISLLILIVYVCLDKFWLQKEE